MEDDEIQCTPEQISTVAQEMTENLLPEKSRRMYNKSYDDFMAWKLENKASSFSENVLLAYFHSLNAKLKPSSLWAEYSKLKSTISIYHQTDISKYSKLMAFLKRKSEGFRPKKAQTFSPDEIKMFIDGAPDHTYLLTKVAVIFGIMGACRRQEIHKLKLKDVIDANDTLVVHIMNTKNRIDRTFTVTGDYYQICKRYMNLRPDPCNNENFFIRYANGKCHNQNVGINMFGKMGKAVAAQLELPHPETYTGHSFRRTSATILVDAGGDMTSLKRHGGWRSTAVAEGYIDNCLRSRLTVSNLIMSSINKNEQTNMASTSVLESKDKLTPCHFTESPANIDSPPTSNIDSPSPAKISSPSPTFTAAADVNNATLSQIIHQNADVHINSETSSTSRPSITISHNTIQNFHLHFHK